ncbi:MAG: FecR domain-containing protein [Nibricoccus sp.]
MKTSRVSPVFACVATLAVSFIFVGAAHAAGRKNPTSKVFIADAKGETLINNGDKIEPLTVKSAYSIEGSTIETKADATATLVFSNGNSVTLNPNSRLEVKKFLQEPFTPNRNDLDVEPSISQTVLNISQGSFSACGSRMVAGSSLTFLTPHGTFNIRGRKVLVETADNETVVSVLDGDITAIDPTTGSSQTLKAGQQAVLRKAGPTNRRLSPSAPFRPKPPQRPTIKFPSHAWPVAPFILRRPNATKSAPSRSSRPTCRHNSP